VDHPVTGRHPLPGLPFRLEGVDQWLTGPSPTLGQHNDDVLGEVVTPAELEALRAAGLVGEWPAGL
jgi:crotonobetainyl-CoA:carnitine CoA-transferase CaiB-like acyl-CoA transferase